MSTVVKGDTLFLFSFFLFFFFFFSLSLSPKIAENTGVNSDPRPPPLFTHTHTLAATHTHTNGKTNHKHKPEGRSDCRGSTRGQVVYRYVYSFPSSTLLPSWTGARTGEPPYQLTGRQGQTHTPSIAFRHLPPKEGRKPVLGVGPDLVFCQTAPVSGTRVGLQPRSQFPEVERF